MWMMELCAKRIEYVFKVKGTIATKIETESTLTTRAGIVIGRTSVGIAQGVIGLLYFLKLGFIPAFVRMVLTGQLAIGTFDFVWTGVAINAQSLIGILHKKKWQTA
jgi:hypothetical protein